MRFNLHYYIAILSLLCCLSLAAAAAQLPVNGVVVDKDKIPMPGVGVLVKGTSSGTMTDDAGRFFIDVPGKESVLRFEMIGFKTREVIVGNELSFYIVLEEEASELDKVVVVGYGTQKKVSVV